MHYRMIVILVASIGASWTGLGLAQELQQDTLVAPASVYVYAVSGTNYN